MIDPRPFPVDLPCPHCGKTDKRNIGELLGKDEIDCRYCGNIVDLTDVQWQDSLKEAIEGYEALFWIK